MKNVIIPIKLGVTIPDKKSYPFTYGNTRCVMYEGAPDIYKYLSKKYPEVEYKDVLKSQFLLVNKLGAEKLVKSKKAAKPAVCNKTVIVNQINKLINQLYTSLDENQYQIEKLKDKASNLDKSINTYNKLLITIPDQIAKLSKNPLIESFDFDDDAVYVKTKKIISKITYPENPDDEHYGPKVTDTFDLGSYLICIPLAYGDQHVRIFNCDYNFKNYDEDGYQGFHITQDGNPCFGNMAGSVSMFHKKMNLVALVPLIINYLHTFTYEKSYAPYALPNDYSEKNEVTDTVEEIKKKFKLMLRGIYGDEDSEEEYSDEF